ncbi:MAG: YdbH domain-containing protein [Phenylobacterium sp.]|uniref:intermembrane phospholipid transport protein YdbH family protein n=1 Tax=Phenylobacterium sp. TaxID=1871053 RepID=UPI0027275B94|nr:YdbH domain-containing protein [Phenylobacterium sp.]MDO8900365.1 YdbH domain-containing protein [Phenylobacterium sp.]
MAALILVLICALALAYAARRALARDALVGWLESRGIEAEASFEALGPRGLVGRLRIGPASAPIVTAERAELSYQITGPWRGRAFGVTLDQIRLINPVIHVGLTPEGPSLGALDPLIAEFRSRPSRDDAPAPEIIVRNGRLHLSHEGGVATVHADARLVQGVLVALTGRLEPTRVAVDGVVLDLGEARLGLVTRDGRTSASLAAALVSGRLGGLEVGPGDLSLAVATPYPDLAARAGNGPVIAIAVLEADSVTVAEGAARKLRLEASFRGAAAGAWDRLVLQGEGAARVISASGEMGEVKFGAVEASAQSGDLAWRRGADGGVSGDVDGSLSGRDIATGGLSLGRLNVNLAGPFRADPSGMTAQLTGSVSAVGAWSGLGAVRNDDADTLAAIKRAAQGFTLSAPDLGVVAEKDGLRVDLRRPALLTAADGGQVTVSQHRAGPLYRGRSGALSLNIAGGGLPRVEAGVSNYRLTEAGLDAQTEVSVATDFGPIRGLETKATGQLTYAKGQLAFRHQGCAPVVMGRFESGETSVEAIRLDLCPGAEPLLTTSGGLWRLSGRVRDATAKVPFLQAEVEGAGGGVALGVDQSGLFLQAEISAARLTDAAETARFHPLSFQGTAGLSRNQWRSELELESRITKVADLVLTHDGATGAGRLQIETGRLEFFEGGLQPADLSPLAEVIGPPAQGAAEFSGGFQWGPEGGGSTGRLTIHSLDFNSPAGAVQGLAGQIDFISLAPLETAEDQRLDAQALQLLAPLTAPRVTFRLSGQSLDLSSGAVNVGGGTVRLEPMTIPLDPTQSWRGELIVEGVQLADLVRETPFSNRVDLMAKVSGRLPFIAGPDGVRFVQGRLEAIEPGRLSIRRAALTDVSASGGGAVAQTPGLGEAQAPLPQAEETNTAVEFAYQAMEHLAFDLLDAEVNSLPGGRLGVLFRVRGEHNPPQRQEIRLTLGELISRDFLKRELPLPSGTKVDLTLDTSLNLDQLLADYAESQAMRGSGEVQPPKPE